MSFIQRIGYYLVGLSIGLVVLAFFFNGKKTSCSYGPNSRVLKEINSKHIIFQENVMTLITNHAVDSSEIYHALKQGNIIFSESTPRKKPCGIYTIRHKKETKTWQLTVKNCDSTTIVTQLKIDSL